MVSTAGAREVLTREREFVAFRGFPVVVTTAELFKKKTEFPGKLHDVSDETLQVNQKGRIVGIPRALVKEVRLIQNQTMMS